MIVMMGATGRVGGAALEAVRGAGQAVRGVSRKLPVTRDDAIAWHEADASDPSRLASAFEGAEAVFVLNPVAVGSSNVHADADRLSASIAQALTTASVPYAVVLSSQGAHLPDGTGVVTTLHRFEAALRDTGIALSVLRPAYFLENWVALAQAAKETGEMPAFFDPVSRTVDAVSARDVGVIAARRLMAPSPGIVNIVGPARVSDAEAADALADLGGRPVRTAAVPLHRIAALHEAAGIGPSLAAATAEMYRALNTAGIPFEEGVGRYEVGRVTLREVLRAVV